MLGSNLKSESTIMKQTQKGISGNITVGRINKLAVTRWIEHGIVLRNHNGDQEVLLPQRYVTSEMKVLGRGIDVFVYHDSDDRLVATTQLPVAMPGEIAYLQALDVQPYGAFVDWGLPKDLFVPLSQQKSHIRVGKKYILMIDIDEQTGRIYATQKIGRYLQPPTALTPSQKLQGIIIAKTPMGYKTILDNRYEGMLYDNEIFQPLKIGQRYDIYIKKIRDDGKLDCSLQPLGSQARKHTDAKLILERLQRNDGKIKATTKSTPEEIRSIFGLSKKSFKAALNELIREGRVEIKDGYILHH